MKKQLCLSLLCPDFLATNLLLKPDEFDKELSEIILKRPLIIIL